MAIHRSTRARTIEGAHAFATEHSSYAAGRGAGRRAGEVVALARERLLNLINQKQVMERGLNVLVLGCYDGSNDLLPLLTMLHRLKSDLCFEVTSIDDSTAISNVLLKTLQSAPYGFSASGRESEQRRWWLNRSQGDVRQSICLVQADLESLDETADLIGEDRQDHYDLVLSFSLFNHLTNWRRLVDRIITSMCGHGLLWVTEYRDPLIAAIENTHNSSVPDCTENVGLLVEVIREFHRARLEAFQSLYCNDLLGSDVLPLREYVTDRLKQIDILELEYESATITSRDIARRLLHQVQHTPIFWGQQCSVDALRMVKGEGLSATWTEAYRQLLKKFQDRLLNGDRSGLSGTYRAKLRLHILEKTSAEAAIPDWRSRLGRVADGMKSFQHSASVPAQDLDALFMQLLLGNQALVRETRFLSLISFGLDVENERTVCDITKPTASFMTMFETRLAHKTMQHFVNHLLFYRYHDTAMELFNKEVERHSDALKVPFSFAEVMFSYGLCGLNWIFRLVDDGPFSCRLYPDDLSSTEKFAVIEIPRTYLRKAESNKYIRRQGKATGLYLNNACIINLAAIVSSKGDPRKSKDRVLDFYSATFDEKTIDAERPDREKCLRQLFDGAKIGGVIVNSKLAEKLANDIAVKAPHFAYLAQSGTLVYLTNSLSSNPAVTNGGFFFCEGDFPVKELKSSASDRFLRYQFLRDALNLYGIRTVLPALLSGQVEVEEQLRFHSVKSALAAIMARNGSHNIGSHVLSGVTLGYRNLSDDQQLFRYIQQRMDYVAQITTKSPDWSTPTWLLQDVLRRFYMQRHLLNYIVQSEGLRAWEPQGRDEVSSFRVAALRESRRLILRVARKENKTQTEVLIGSQSKGIDGKDVLLAIPGGVVGGHAFYTVLENLIRNFAKHGYARRSKGDLIVTLEYSDDPDVDFVEFLIYDNCVVSESGKGIRACPPANRQYGRSDTTALAQHPLEVQLNERISRSIVDNEGRLRLENLGLAECKISLAYLNKWRIRDLASDGQHLLYESSEPEEEGGCKTHSGLMRAEIRSRRNAGVKGPTLGFRFAVPRPKELVVIGPALGEDTKLRIDSPTAKKMGIYYYDASAPQLNLAMDFQYALIAHSSIDQLSEANNRGKEQLRWDRTMPVRLVVQCSKKIAVGHSVVPREAATLVSSQLPEWVGKHEIKDYLEGVRLAVYEAWVKHIVDLSVDNIGADNPVYLYVAPYGHERRPSGVGDTELWREILRAVHGSVAKINPDRFITRMLESRTERQNSRLRKLISEMLRESVLDDNTVSTGLLRVKDSIPPGFNESLGDLTHLMHNISAKYAEKIETLPRQFVAGNDGTNEDVGVHFGNAQADQPIGWIKNVLTFNEWEGLWDDDEDRKRLVTYKRHAHTSNPRNSGIYYESLSGAQSHFALLEGAGTLSVFERKMLSLKLVENACLRYLIIDERVATFHSGAPQPVKDWLEASGVTVALAAGNGNNWRSLVSGKPQRRMLHDPSKHQFDLAKLNQRSQSRDVLDYHIVIIHQGVLDKLKGGGVSVNSLYLQMCQRVPFVYITTGRGHTSDLPIDAKIIAFANVKEYLMGSHQQKFLLTSLLMSILPGARHEALHHSESR